MNLRPHKREDPEVSLTPLIDVVFLLLIFFMVTTTFRKESEYEIVLPEASQEPVPAEQQRLVVSIDANGNYSINEQRLSDNGLATLRQALADAVGDKPDQPLILRADADTPHQAVVRALDAAGQVGLNRIAIATVYGAQAQ